MKYISLISVIFLLVFCKQEYKNNVIVNKPSTESRPEIDSNKIKNKAEEALQFCRSKNFNTDFCILIDMSIHSGLKRFFIWNFKTHSVSQQYLVGHGCCSNQWSWDGSKDTPKFSNEDGSHLSALGKYKLHGRGHSD